MLDLSVTRHFLFRFLAGLAALLLNGPLYARDDVFEQPPVNYHKAPVHDPIALLSRAVLSGDVALTFNQKTGYLPSVLSALKIPHDSQTLVFSKTSLQLRRISPTRPRAIYFNDTVYVGYCYRGDVLELAATDPTQGAVFYTLRQQQTDKPTFVRDRGNCLSCHASSRTEGVPGYLMRSVFPDERGYPHFGSGTFDTNSSSPLSERWGGWYVTGTHGHMRHMGNVISKGDSQNATVDREAGANHIKLSPRVPRKRYLSSHSDIVALMVLGHQTQVHNAITAAGFATRQALYRGKNMNRYLEKKPDFISETVKRQIELSVQNVVDRLFMVDEFVLTDTVTGSSGFAKVFAQQGPFDSKGRSLRQFDLTKRLFRYPCSYLIYSEAFRRLPETLHHRIVEKIHEVLSSADTTDGYEHLSIEDRLAIREILQETHPDFRNAE